METINSIINNNGKINLLIVIILILYISFIKPSLPRPIYSFFNNTFIKIIANQI